MITIKGLLTFAAAICLTPLSLAQEEEPLWRNLQSHTFEELRDVINARPDSGVASTIFGSDNSSARAFVTNTEPLQVVSQPANRSIAVEPVPVTTSNTCDLITPEIQSLARGLQYDPLNIFHFVRNQIDYECYFGAKKGAHLTLMEMGGNDYDQAALMVALLRASGYTAKYKAAPVAFAADYLLSLSGISEPYKSLNNSQFAASITTVEHPISANDPDLDNLRIKYALNTYYLDRGFPIIDRSIGDGPLTFIIPHVWVELQIDGQTFNLSPSFKNYKDSTPVDLTPTGMSKSSLLSAVGGTVDTVNGKKWVQNLQYNTLASSLAGYTSQVLANMKAGYDGESVESVFGIRKLIPVVYSSLADVPDMQASGADWASLETWNELLIPEERTAKVTLSAAGAVVNNMLPTIVVGSATYVPYVRAFTMPELRGRKLSLSFSGTVARTATFSLDDIPEGAPYSGMIQAALYVRIAVDHPCYKIALNNNAEYEKQVTGYADSTTTEGYLNGYGSSQGIFCYSIVTSTGDSQKLLNKRLEILEKYKRDGLADDDIKIKTEILNILGHKWYQQTRLYMKLAGSHFNVVDVDYHRIGRVAKSIGYYIDISNQVGTALHRNLDSGINYRYADITSLMMSAMEHGVIDQSVAKPVGVSTAEMIWAANNQGDKIYRMDTGSWAADKSNLSNYPSNTTTSLETVFSKPNTVGLLPQVGNRSKNNWQGVGYMLILNESTRATQIGGTLAGGLNGGYATIGGSIGSNPFMEYLWNAPSYDMSAATPIAQAARAMSTPQFQSLDPVDLLSGAFVLDETDYAIGRLSVSRHYNSHQRSNKSSGLGYGWVHGNDIRLAERSSVLAALGGTNIYQASAIYLQILAADMVHDNSIAKDWATTALIARWGANTIFNNSVSIRFGNKTIEFIKSPDGSFIAPVGLNFTLSKTGGTAATATNEAVLGIYTLKERNGNVFLFNNKGKIATITDPNGNTQTFTYNSSGQLTSIVDSFGHTLTYSWASGKISSISDGTQRSVSFGYSSDNLSTITDVEGKVWTYQYDSEHRMISRKDPDNRIMVENDFDFGNRVIRQRNKGDVTRLWHYAWAGSLNLEQNPAGGITGYHYDTKGRSIGISDPLGNSTFNVYDGQDRILLSTDAKGAEASRTWDSDNDVVTATDPLGNSVSYTYDSLKRPIKVTDKRGKDTVYTWSAQHQLLTTTDPLNHVTTKTYFANGKLKTVTDAENKVTTYAYDTKGFLSQSTLGGASIVLTNNVRGDVLTYADGESRTTTHTYNKRGQLLTSTLPAIAGEPASVTTCTYDNSGNLASRTDANGNVSTFTYDTSTNPLTVTLPALPAGNNVITMAYDLRDWPVSTSNSLTHTITTEYDAAKRITAIVDPLARRSESTPDENGRVVAMKDPLLRITQQVYNARGESERSTDALVKHTDSVFDPNGNLTTRTNRRGKIFSFSYDDANRPLTLTTPGAKITTTGYLNNNLVASVTEPSSQNVQFVYNSRNLLQSKSDPTGTIAYTYDLSGLPKTVTEGSAVITRTYDARGRLKTYTNADGDVLQYKFDAHGNLIRLTYPDNKQVNYTYNARNLLASVTDWANRVTTYQYDSLGRLTGITRPNTTTSSISYDAAGQVNNIKEASQGTIFSLLSFHYDETGQIDRKFRAPSLQGEWIHPKFAAIYDDDNRLLTVNALPVTHDPDGNMTAGPIRSDSGTLSLIYNSRNQLVSGDGLTYTYDAEGHRRTLTNPAGTTRFVTDTSSKLSKLLVRHNPDGSKTRYVYGIGLLYEVDDAGNTKTHHYDQVGSTIVRTNDSGAVIGRAEYSSYGQLAQTAGDLNTPFLYNGRAGVQTDLNGLLYMRARYYSPYLMRFLNPDPIGFSGGSNWFAYADGNPISLSDPFGLCASVGDSIWNTLRDAGKAQYGNITDGYNTVLDYVGWSVKGTGQTIYNGTQALGRQFPILGEMEQWAISNMWMVDALGPVGALGSGFSGGLRTSVTAIDDIALATSNNTTRVGRWMSEAEHAAMVESRTVQAPLNGAAATHVTVPPNPTAFTPPPQSTIFSEFNVPTSQLNIHDAANGWGRVFGPGSLEARLAESKGLPGPTSMPPATNIRITNP